MVIRDVRHQEPDVIHVQQQQDEQGEGEEALGVAPQGSPTAPCKGEVPASGSHADVHAVVSLASNLIAALWELPGRLIMSLALVW